MAIQTAKIIATEVIDGIQYKVSITIGDIVFSYELGLPKSFDSLDQMENISPEWLINSTRLNVSAKNQELNLTPKEKGFFLSYGGLVAGDLFYSPQREDLRQNGKIGTDVLNYYLDKMNENCVIEPTCKAQHSLEHTMEVDTEHPTIKGLLEKVSKG